MSPRIPVPAIAALLISTSTLAAEESMDMSHDHMTQSPMMHGMSGALGSYPMTRESSGTSWQPDAATHAGLHEMTEDWMFMGHAVLNGIYDWQGGPRGANKAFVAGMVMGAARRTFDDGSVLNMRAMLSPDPLMGKRGYPLLFQSGESADGKTALTDRQHPHDLFMELAVSYSRPIAAETSAFIYVGLPGEPAFGPPAFMHRTSIMDSPEAPISHHWLDSTHTTFGVATAGLVYKNWKAEASRFTGREPDESRFDIDHARFDSTSARLSWNPGEHWSLQGSWAHLHSPEQLDPLDNETRWSLSAIYTTDFGEDGQWSTTAAWGRKKAHGENLDAWILETAVKPTSLWTVFARAERVEEAELSAGPPQTVSKASIGVVRDLRVAAHVLVGLGGLYAFNWPSGPLKALYGGNPGGAMVFVRLKIE